MKTTQVPFTILVDQQEKAAYTFDGIRSRKNRAHTLIVPAKRVHLVTGDYTIEGLEDLVTIERKSLDDLCGSLAHKKGGPDRRGRLKREHERMARMEYAAVVIEGFWLSAAPEGRKMNMASVRGTEESWTMRYGVPWIFAGSRHAAEETTFWRLYKFWESFQDRKKRNDS